MTIYHAFSLPHHSKVGVTFNFLVLVTILHLPPSLLTIIKSLYNMMWIKSGKEADRLLLWLGRFGDVPNTTSFYGVHKTLIKYCCFCSIDGVPASFLALKKSVSCSCFGTCTLAPASSKLDLIESIGLVNYTKWDLVAPCLEKYDWYVHATLMRP